MVCDEEAEAREEEEVLSMMLGSRYDAFTYLSAVQAEKKARCFLECRKR